MKIENEFIPYEQALELKELGFDEPCFAWYVSESYGLEYGEVIKSDLIRDGIVAPTYSQAFRWFREKHNLYTEIRTFAWDYDEKLLGFSIRTYLNPVNIETERKIYGEVYETYEEAELECLKKLIEIIKEK
jgi:hypothetical protein